MLGQDGVRRGALEVGWWYSAEWTRGAVGCGADAMWLQDRLQERERVWL